VSSVNIKKRKELIKNVCTDRKRLTEHKGIILIMAGYPKNRAEKATNPLPGVPIDREKLKKEIIKQNGNLTRVAMAFKCARNSIRRIVSTDPEIKEVLEEARERIVDEVEDAFTKRAIAGDTTASIFFLKTRGRERGYDQDFRADLEAVTRAAMSFALNKSRNPAETD